MKLSFPWFKKPAARSARAPASDVVTLDAPEDSGVFAHARPPLEWRFKQITPNDTLHNASHIEFFHNDALQSPVDSLVREDIQNRLDAHVPGSPPVEVRYQICGPEEVETFSPWFKKLEQHLRSPQAQEELGGEPHLERPLRWLVIEDFNTTGLQGDPLCYTDAMAARSPLRNDFFWFVRNVGRSVKIQSERGRWGLGKLVYAALSDIRTFFAYTVRRNDNMRLLIGRSVLALHEIEHDQHDSEGYFGSYAVPHLPFFAMPETEATTLDQFAADFHLTRQEDEPGLSIIIPWPEEEITFEALVGSLVENWFWVMLEDGLVAHVTHQPSGQTQLLSKDTIASAIAVSGGRDVESLLKKLMLARLVQRMPQTSPDRHTLRLCPEGVPPRWDHVEDRFASPDALRSARQAFQSGKLVMFEVPVRVNRTDGSADDVAPFEVYMQRGDEDGPCIETFLRHGLAISGQQFLHHPGVQALIRIRDNALGTLLGDAESPAHNRWERNGKNFRGRYEHGAQTLVYVQFAAARLCELLLKEA